MQEILIYLAGLKKLGYRDNDLSESLPYHREVFLEKDYSDLQFNQANEELLSEALLGEFAEF